MDRYDIEVMQNGLLRYKNVEIGDVKVEGLNVVKVKDADLNVFLITSSPITITKVEN